MSTSRLDPRKVSKERLLALAEKVPGAWIGMKITTLLLVLEGQRPLDFRCFGPDPDECKLLDTGGECE